jgi:hypothetical protein
VLYRNMVCIWCNMLHRAQETERLREAVRLSESAEQSMAETLLNLQALKCTRTIRSMRPSGNT